MAQSIWILTAFSVVPPNLLILRCCLSHLKTARPAIGSCTNRLPEVRLYGWRLIERWTHVSAHHPSRAHTLKRPRIVLCRLVNSLFYNAVWSYFFRQSPLLWHRIVLKILLRSYHKISSGLKNAIQLFEVMVGTVENIVRTWFKGDFFHCLWIVNRCVGDVKELRNLRLHVIESVNFHTSFLLAELRPPEYRQT